MSALPRVSVVVPAYNAARTIEQTLRSALDQDLDGVEVVVVDDGSRDRTADVAASIDDRIVCFSTPNRGVAQARNHGIAHSRGELVAFLDADDLWLPGKLRRQFAALDVAPDAGLAFTAITIVDDDLRRIGSARAHERDDYTAALLHQCEIAISTVVVRREVLLRAGGFHPSFSQCADWELWLRLSLLTSFVPVDEELVLYRAGVASMSRNVRLLEQDSTAMFTSFFAHPRDERHRRLRRRALAHNWNVLAASYLDVGRRCDAARCVTRAVASSPAAAAGDLGERVARRLRGQR